MATRRANDQLTIEAIQLRAAEQLLHVLVGDRLQAAAHGHAVDDQATNPIKLGAQ